MLLLCNASYRLKAICGEGFSIEIQVRVAEQQEGERDFHLFYQACAAASTLVGRGDDVGELTYEFPQLRESSTPASIDLSGFGEYSQFRYLTRSSCWQLKDVSDVLQFEHTIHAMLTVGIPVHKVNSILACVCAVLHLGSVAFIPNPKDTEASIANLADAKCQKSIETAGRCLGVCAQKLAHALSHKTIKTATEGLVVADLRVEQADACRDAAARYLYIYSPLHIS